MSEGVDMEPTIEDAIKAGLPLEMILRVAVDLEKLANRLAVHKMMGHFHDATQQPLYQTALIVLGYLRPDLIGIARERTPPMLSDEARSVLAAAEAAEKTPPVTVDVLTRVLRTLPARPHLLVPPDRYQETLTAVAGLPVTSITPIVRVVDGLPGPVLYQPVREVD